MKDDSYAIKKLGQLVWAAGHFKGSFQSFWPDENDTEVKEGVEPPTKEWWDNIYKTEVLIERKKNVGRN